MPTKAALKYRGDMLLHFPLLVDWGITNCRHIAGSTSWSQHAWGNAVDLHPLTKSYGDKAYAYVQANAARLSVAHLLWQVPDHYDHIHADFNPQGVGTPPCAGGALQWSSGGPVVATSSNKNGVITPIPKGGCPPGYLTLKDGCWSPTKAGQYPGGGIPIPTGVPGLGGLTGWVGDLLRGLVPILKITAGGVLMLAGGAIIVVGVTGQGNKVATAARAVSTKGRSAGTAPVPTRPDEGGDLGPVGEEERIQAIAQREAQRARQQARTAEAKRRVVTRTEGGRTSIVTLSKDEAGASDDLAEDVADARKVERRATSRARLRGLQSSRKGG